MSLRFPPFFRLVALTFLRSEEGAEKGFQSGVLALKAQGGGRAVRWAKWQLIRSSRLSTVITAPSHCALEAPALTLDSNKDLLLTLLALPGPSGRQGEPIRGTTRLVKLSFLLQNYQALRPFFDRFRFEANHFGPFSEKVQEDIEALKTLRLVEVAEMALGTEPLGDELLLSEGASALAQQVLREYRVTPLGQLVAQKLISDAKPEQLQALRDIKGKFNGMALDALLSYVYTTSDPRYLEKSKIRALY